MNAQFTRPSHGNNDYGRWGADRSQPEAATAHTQQRLASSRTEPAPTGDGYLTPETRHRLTKIAGAHVRRKKSVSKPRKSSSTSPGSDVHTVEILKQPGQTLGVYIREGDGRDRTDGIFISRIPDGSLVGNDDLLRPGDEIVRVNGVCVSNKSLDDVVVLMSIPRRLVLRLRTPPSRACPDHPAEETDTAATYGRVNHIRPWPHNDTALDAAETHYENLEDIRHEIHASYTNSQVIDDSTSTVTPRHGISGNATRAVRTDLWDISPDQYRHEASPTPSLRTRHQMSPRARPERRTPTSPLRLPAGDFCAEMITRPDDGSTFVRMKTPTRYQLSNKTGYYSTDVEAMFRVQRRNLHRFLSREDVSPSYDERRLRYDGSDSEKSVLSPDGYTSEPEHGGPRYNLTLPSAPGEAGLSGRLRTGQSMCYSLPQIQCEDNTAELKHWLHRFAKLSQELQMLNDTVHPPPTPRGGCVRACVLKCVLKCVWACI